LTEYDSECWPITNGDARKIDVLDQWCLWRLLGIKWYQFVSNAEVQQRTIQSLLASAVQSRSLFLFGLVAQMDNRQQFQTIVDDEPISSLPLSTHSAVEMLHDSSLYKSIIDIDMTT